MFIDEETNKFVYMGKSDVVWPTWKLNLFAVYHIR